MTNEPLLEPASPTELEGLVAYAESAVVSRTLSKGPSGTLTVFALDAGQEISVHTTPHEAFAVGLDGSTEFTVGGRKAVLRKAGILRLPADVPHALKAVERCKLLLVMFKKL